MLIRGLLRVDAGDRHPQGMVDGRHPVGVSPSQVVVDGNQMTALTGERIQVKGESGHQGLALAGPHLGNLSLMKDDAAHQLDVKVALLYGSFGRLADSGECFRQQLIKRCPLAQPGLELIALGLKLVVTKFLKLRLKLVYPADNRPEPLNLFLVGIPESSQPLEHSNPTPSQTDG